jgi:ABC-type phosphate transport system substrate-binding protein
VLHINRAGFIIGLTLSLASRAAVADVVAVVSAKSSITTLSIRQITDLFLGKVTRFPNGVPATPIDQAEGSAVRDDFYKATTGKSPAQIKAYWSKIIFTGRGQPPPTVTNNIEVKKRVVENPTAIGYIDKASVDDSVKIVLISSEDAG